jgi:hypothetical protein
MENNTNIKQYNGFNLFQFQPSTQTETGHGDSDADDQINCDILIGQFSSIPDNFSFEVVETLFKHVTAKR